MKSDFVSGSQLPDFELPDHNNQMRKLSEIQEIDPLILLLSRCFHSPDDILQHQQLVSFYPEIKVGYTKLVTITTESLDEINRFRSGIGAKWTFLSDPKRVVQKDLKTQDLSDVKKNSIPYTIILKPGLTIYKIYNGSWFWDRPSIEDLRKDLRTVHQEIRPDLNDSQPDLQDSFLAGENDNYSHNNDIS